MATAPLKAYGNKFIHHDFAQFGKQHSRYKGILLSVLLSQQYSEICFISLAAVNPKWDFV